MPAEKDDSNKLIVDVICTLISSTISLIGIIYVLINVGVAQLNFAIGWFIFWMTWFISSNVLLVILIIYRKKNLLRKNLGVKDINQ